MILCSCANCFLIQSIISFKKRTINSWVIFSLWEASQYFSNLTTILTTETEHHRWQLSKENTIECKHKSVWFSSFSLPNPWFSTVFLLKGGLPYKTIFCSCCYFLHFFLLFEEKMFVLEISTILCKKYWKTCAS